MIKIDKNIPYKGSKVEYPFELMKKGDSFLLPDDSKLPNCRMMASKFSQKKDKTIKFSIIKTSEGYRCWRVK
jgi:hypothetical protein